MFSMARGKDPLKHKAGVEERRLISWFTGAMAAGILPTQPFMLHPGIEVQDPEVLYHYIIGALSRDVQGQARVGVIETIRRLKEVAGGI